MFFPSSRLISTILSTRLPPFPNGFHSRQTLGGGLLPPAAGRHGLRNLALEMWRLQQKADGAAASRLVYNVHDSTERGKMQFHSRRLSGGKTSNGRRGRRKPHNGRDREYPANAVRSITRWPERRDGGCRPPGASFGIAMVTAQEAPPPPGKPPLQFGGFVQLCAR